MKAVSLAVLFALSAASAMAEETMIRVPLIDAKGAFISERDASLPKYVSFSARNLGAECEKMEQLREKNDALSGHSIWYAYPSDYARTGTPICYQGDVNQALDILLKLADCALSPEFMPSETSVESDVVSVTYTWNDSGKESRTSVIRRCENLR